MRFHLAATRSGALSAITLVFLLSGCGSRTPTTVHGKSVEYWLTALHNSDVQVRKKAVECLGNVGADNPATVPALIEALEDRDARVRGAAVLALLKIGPDAGEAVPALRKALQDKDARVQDYAVKALTQIEGSSSTNARPDVGKES